MLPCKIRRFSEGDCNIVFELSEDLGLSPWSVQDYRDELERGDSRMLIAERGRSVCGFIVGRIVPGNLEDEVDAEIYNIGVSAAYQRSGVGAALIEKFLGLCRAAGAKFVWLEVRSANSNAIAFYERAGFQEFATRPKFYRDPEDDAIVMRLDTESFRVNFV